MSHLSGEQPLRLYYTKAEPAHYGAGNRDALALLCKEPKKLVWDSSGRPAYGALPLESFLNPLGIGPAGHSGACGIGLPAVQKVPSTRPFPGFSPRSATLSSVSGPTDVGIPPGTVSRATAKAWSESLTAATMIRLRRFWPISASGPVTSIIQPFMFPSYFMTNRIARTEGSPITYRRLPFRRCAERLST